MKREPAGTSKGGQFAATGRDEVSLQGVETPEQVRARLCPPHAEEYPLGGWRGAYYDETMTPAELEESLRAAYDEAKSAGLIDSDVDITIETREDEVNIAVVHPDEGVYEDNYDEDTGRTVREYSEGFHKMMTICNEIQSSYALIDYDDYGYERVRENTASIHFTYPQEQKRLARASILARIGAHYGPTRTTEELQENLERSFAEAQRNGIIREDLNVETTIDGDTVHVVVSGMSVAEAFAEYTDENGETQKDFSPEYTDLVEVCGAIRDAHELRGKNRVELGFELT